MPPESHFFDFVFSERDYRFLDTLSKAIAAAQTPQAAIEAGLQETCVYAHWEFGQSWIPDAAERQLDPGPFWMAQPRMKAYRDVSVASESKFGIGLLWGAFLNRRPVICLELEAEMTFRRSAGARESGLRGGIFVPVVEGSQTRGVVEFLSGAPKAEDARRGGFAMAAAGKLAAAIKALQAKS